MPFSISTGPALPCRVSPTSESARTVFDMIHLQLPAFTYAAARRFRNAAALLIFTIFPAFAEPTTLLALGDSLTAGYGLPPDQGLVPQLQGWLTAHGTEVAVVNAGVSGDTTAGGLSRLDWSLTPDVDALMVTLGGNDMLRGLPPEEARGVLREFGATYVVVCGKRVPPGMSAAERAASTASKWRSAAAGSHRSGPALQPDWTDADRCGL